MNENGETIVPFQPEDEAEPEEEPLNRKDKFIVEAGDSGTHRKQLGGNNSSEVLHIPQDEGIQETNLSPYQPHPPSLPKPPSVGKGGRNISFEEKIRRRRLRSSQESLTDPAETCSSTDSLKEDSAPVLNSALALKNGQVSARNERASGGSPPFWERRSSLPEVEKHPHMQSHLVKQLSKPSKIIVPPIQPSGSFPPLEYNVASTSLRTANRIDRDCLDYAKWLLTERLHWNFSNSRILETMVSDSASVNSMKSTFSVLNPIRPKDVRNR